REDTTGNPGSGGSHPGHPGPDAPARTRSIQSTCMMRTATTLILLASSVGPALTGCAYAGPRDVMSDTWVATDALGRGLPLAEEVGPPRADKFVGVFYFLWLGQAGDEGPFDIAKILARDPAALRNPR